MQGIYVHKMGEANRQRQVNKCVECKCVKLDEVCAIIEGNSQRDKDSLIFSRQPYKPHIAVNTHNSCSCLSTTNACKEIAEEAAHLKMTQRNDKRTT